MKTITRFLALALAGCLMLEACEKEEDATNNTITVNGVTYENVEATVDDSQRGLWFTFVLTEDGKTIVVVDGKVSEIKDPAAEVAPAEGQSENEVTPAALHRLMATKFGMSFDEKYDAIYAALRAIGIEYPWIAEAGDDYAVVEIWDGEDYRYVRYALSFGEDGKVTLGESSKVKRIFVPEDMADPFETSAELARVKAELETVKKTPAGQPAHATFTNAGDKKTAPAGLQNPRGLENLSRFAKK